MSEGRRGALAGVLAYGLWGLFPIYFHHTAPATPVEVLFHRMVWTLLVVAIWLTARRKWAWWTAARRDGALVRRVALGSFMLSLNWGVYIWAVNNDHVVDAAERLTQPRSYPNVVRTTAKRSHMAGIGRLVVEVRN